MRAFAKIAALLGSIAAFGLGHAVAAQGQFDPVITINDSVVSQFELDQRRRLLELFRTPGDLDAIARNGLIEDRLKQQEMDRFGLSLSDESLAAALEEFAGRADMDMAQFSVVLQQNNIDPASLRDFVRIGVSWRDFVRSRFNRQITITEADIDRAIARQGNSTTAIEVLLSEIIIPAPPPRAAEAEALANQIAQYTSYGAFEAAAREVSALPSRENGGRLDWLPITNYPPQLRQLILDLRPGHVTAPIIITNGVALFQMRDVREVPQAVSAPSSIEFATYAIAGRDAEASLREAADVALQVDTCDDLYGVAGNQPAEALLRDSLPPDNIPADVALELARLDPGEVSYNLTRDNGLTRVFVMLCGRTGDATATTDRAEIGNQLRSARLAGLADALLEDLRAAAVISTP